MLVFLIEGAGLRDSVGDGAKHAVVVERPGCCSTILLCLPPAPHCYC